MVWFFRDEVLLLERVVEGQAALLVIVQRGGRRGCRHGPGTTSGRKG